MSDLNNQNTIAFCESLTIRDVVALKELLLMRFQDFDEVLLDFPADAPADFAGIQLIGSAYRYAIENGKRFGLAKPVSGPLAALLEQGGFLREPFASPAIGWAGAAQ